MAGMKVWVPGEEVLAADLQGFVQEQTVPRFTTAAQRDAQWPAPPDGALSVLTDSSFVWLRTAGVWRVISPARSVVGAAMSTDFVTPAGQNLLAYSRAFSGGAPNEDVTIHVTLFVTQATKAAFTTAVTGGPLPFHHTFDVGTSAGLVSFQVIWPAPSPNPIDLAVNVNAWGAQPVTLVKASSSIAVYTRHA